MCGLVKMIIRRLRGGLTDERLLHRIVRFEIGILNDRTCIQKECKFKFDLPAVGEKGIRRICEKYIQIDVMFDKRRRLHMHLREVKKIFFSMLFK